MKQYITPAIKNVKVVVNESMMLSGSLGSDETNTIMDANGHRGSRGSWGNLWDDSAEE